MNNINTNVPQSQSSALPRKHHRLGRRILALSGALGGCLGVATAIWTVIMRGSFSEVIEVCGGAVLVGRVGLIVRHGAYKPRRTHSGTRKVFQATMNLQVGPY